MPNRSKTPRLPGNGKHGADSALVAARKCRSLISRQRVPVTEGWASRIGKRFRDGVIAHLLDRRTCTLDDLQPMDFAVLDSCYFVVCGLAQGYGFLGAKGWLDEEAGGFRPVVEMCLKLQRMLQDNLGKLGIADPPKELDVFDALYSSVCDDPAKSPSNSSGAEIVQQAQREEVASDDLDLDQLATLGSGLHEETNQ